MYRKREIRDRSKNCHGRCCPRQVLGKLIGEDSARHRLVEVEVVIQSSMREGSSPASNLPSVESAEREPSSAVANEEQKSGGVFSGKGGQGTRTPVTTTAAAEEGYQLPEGHLGRLLGNERLAHEILVNPEFQVSVGLG